MMGSWDALYLACTSILVLMLCCSFSTLGKTNSGHKGSLCVISYNYHVYNYLKIQSLMKKKERRKREGRKEGRMESREKERREKERNCRHSGAQELWLLCCTPHRTHTAFFFLSIMFSLPASSEVTRPQRKNYPHTLRQS